MAVADAYQARLRIHCFPSYIPFVFVLLNHVGDWTLDAMRNVSGVKSYRHIVPHGVDQSLEGFVSHSCANSEWPGYRGRLAEFTVSL